MTVRNPRNCYLKKSALDTSLPVNINLLSSEHLAQKEMPRPQFCSTKKPTGLAMGFGAVAAMAFGAYKVIFSLNSHQIPCMEVKF